MSKPSIFAQITKVDAEKRLVYGRAAQEMVDRSGEIFDYASSKPYFEAWSKDVSKSTDGKSLGNIRSMHGNVAAGKVVDMMFHDTDKAIDIVGKVVDDNEWAKVLEGVHTGFSIGGEYVGAKTVEKVGNAEVKRYTAKPSEISLVDRPCIPSARFFDVQKADGVVEKVEFKNQPEVEYNVEGSEEDIAALAKLLTDNKLTVGGVVKMVQNTLDAAKAVPAADATVAKAASVVDSNSEDDTNIDNNLTPTEKEGIKTSDKVVEEGKDKAADRAPGKTSDTASGPKDDASAVEVPAKDSKSDDDNVAKLEKAALSDSLTKALGAIETLQKEVALLKAQPMPATISLRVVSKAADLGTNDLEKTVEVEPVRAITNDPDQIRTASLIKAVHAQGGQRLGK